MIEFRFDSKTVRLERGGTFATTQQNGYQDIADQDILELIDRVKEGAPWRAAVRERFATTNPWVCRIVTDPSRDLFFRMFARKPGSAVLDVGAGWGQIALPFAKDCEVVAVEPNRAKIAFMRTVANQEGFLGKMRFIQADFLDLEFVSRFELISCVGVLEWIPRFRNGNAVETQIAFLKRAKAALAPQGQLVVGIENRLGLKYLLGAPDDHIGVPGIAVLDHELANERWTALRGEALRVLTHTRAELAQLLESAGLRMIECYAAYPDYKVPQVILPVGGKVNEYFLNGNFVLEHDGSTGCPLPFQEDLRSHYRSLAKLGIAGDFAPSYYLVAEPILD